MQKNSLPCSSLVFFCIKINEFSFCFFLFLLLFLSFFFITLDSCKSFHYNIFFFAFSSSKHLCSNLCVYICTFLSLSLSHSLTLSLSSFTAREYLVYFYTFCCSPPPPPLFTKSEASFSAF